jgi:hypothetical protein
MSTALQALAWLGMVIPRVDDPWPGHIGLSFPFTAAGAGSVLGNFSHPGGTAAERDRVSRIASLSAFLVAAALYLLAVVVQLTSKG